MNKNGASSGEESLPNTAPATGATKQTWVTPRLRKQAVYETTNMMMAGATDGTSLS